MSAFDLDAARKDLAAFVLADEEGDDIEDYAVKCAEQLPALIARIEELEKALVMACKQRDEAVENNQRLRFALDVERAQIDRLNSAALRGMQGIRAALAAEKETG